MGFVLPKKISLGGSGLMASCSVTVDRLYTEVRFFPVWRHVSTACMLFVQILSNVSFLFLDHSQIQCI